MKRSVFACEGVEWPSDGSKALYILAIICCEAQEGVDFGGVARGGDVFYSPQEGRIGEEAVLGDPVLQVADLGCS